MPPVKLELEVPTQFNTAASLGQKEVALIGYYACFGISNLGIQHLMHKKWAKWFTEELIASHVAAIEHTQGWKFDHLFVRSEHIKVGHWMGGVLEGHLPGTKGLRDMRHIVEWEDWEKSLRYSLPPSTDRGVQVKLEESEPEDDHLEKAMKREGNVCTQAFRFPESYHDDDTSLD